MIVKFFVLRPVDPNPKLDAQAGGNPKYNKERAI
jgi:hypothetical protein